MKLTFGRKGTQRLLDYAHDHGQKDILLVEGEGVYLTNMSRGRDEDALVVYANNHGPKRTSLPFAGIAARFDVRTLSDALERHPGAHLYVSLRDGRDTTFGVEERLRSCRQQTAERRAEVLKAVSDKTREWFAQIESMLREGVKGRPNFGHKGVE